MQFILQQQFREKVNCGKDISKVNAESAVIHQKFKDELRKNEKNRFQRLGLISGKLRLFAKSSKVRVNHENVRVI